MESGADEDLALHEVIRWIQRLTVNEIGLDVDPADVAADSKFIGQGLSATGGVLNLDSLDLAGVIVELDQTFTQALTESSEKRSSDINLIEDIQKKFQNEDLTIEKLARFLLDRFPLEPERIRDLAPLAECGIDRRLQ